MAYHTRPWGENWAEAREGIRESGFSGIETYCLSQWYSKPDEFRSLLEDTGLSLTAMEYGGEWIVPDRLETEREGANRLAHFLAEMGARVMVVSGGRRPPEGAPRESYASLANVLNDLGRDCAERGLSLCYHPKAGTMVEYRDQIELLMEATLPECVGLCLDTGDLAASGSDPLEVVKALGSRIRHVHLKDMDWFTHRPLPPGEGSLELAALIGELQAQSYDGCITVELEESEDPLGEAAAARHYLHGLGL